MNSFDLGFVVLFWELVILVWFELSFFSAQYHSTPAHL